MKKEKCYSRVIEARAQESFSAPTGASSYCCSHWPVGTRRALSDNTLKETKNQKKKQASACASKSFDYPPQLKYAPVIHQGDISQPFVWRVLEGTVRVLLVLHDCTLQLNSERVGRKANGIPQTRRNSSLNLKRRGNKEKFLKYQNRNPGLEEGAKTSKLQNVRKMPSGQAKTHRQGKNAFGERSS